MDEGRIGHRLIHPSPKICFHPFIYIAYAIIPIYPRLKKKRTLVTIPRHPHYFVRSIKRRRNFQFPNTNKDPTFLRWIPSIFSFKNSHDNAKKIERIIINYIIRGKIEKSFNRWLEGRVRKGLEINVNSRRVGKLARFQIFVALRIDRN